MEVIKQEKKGRYSLIIILSSENVSNEFVNFQIVNCKNKYVFDSNPEKIILVF